MHLPVLLFGIVLLPKVYTLKCYNRLLGVSGADTVKECPSSSYMCGAMRIVSYGGGSKINDAQLKGCFLPYECEEGSVNFGISRIVIPIKCCNSDLCNTHPAPEPNKAIPNGKKCYHCNGPKCVATLNCEDKEDYCFSNSVTKDGKRSELKGCATKQTCSKDITATIKATIKGDISCCHGDYCNSAISSSASLLLLVASFISLLMFS